MSEDPQLRFAGVPSSIALSGRCVARDGTMGRSVKKAVFPAAGLGVAFLPATKAQPKEMLPLVDKPMIQYVVEEAVSAGFSLLIIVTGRGKRAIEDHFDASVELETYLQARGKDDELAQIRAISDLGPVCYVRQKEPLGLGHAILCSRALVGDEPFAVLLGDDIIIGEPSCTSQLLTIFERYGDPVLAVQRVPPYELPMYGVVQGSPVSGNVYLVEDLVEKAPANAMLSDLAIVGRYVLTPDIFSILRDSELDQHGEIQLTNALKRLRERRKIYAVLFEGYRYDVGHKLGFLKATVEMALSRQDLGDAFRVYLKSMAL